jgi:trans-2,3-dihydro-3-hydroxyanthranilate isomerase
VKGAASSRRIIGNRASSLGRQCETRARDGQLFNGAKVKRRLYQLDVFTNTPFAGNPLAVVTDGDGLSSRRMLDIAREMNLSETVFVQKPTNAQALARLRIFTTQSELRLAGHPVIGTWFLLAQLGVVPAQRGSVHIWQQTGAGLLPVEIAFRDGRPERVTMQQKPAEFRSDKISRKDLAKALGLNASDISQVMPVTSVSTGIFNLMVPIVKRSTLSRISADSRALREALHRADTVAYCFALEGKGQAYSRGMLTWELYEDPATGSAAGSLGAYLVRHGKLAAGEHLSVTQGVEMGRTSKIGVVVDEQRNKLVPRVSGEAVLIFEGSIEA